MASRSDVARTISTRLNPRALNFAARWEVPSPQTMSAPTNGISQRRDKTPTMSGSSEETLHEPLAEHEEEQDDQSHDDDPGVALHLARLPLPQTPARADCLEAVVAPGDSDEGKRRVGSAEEDEVAKPLHRVREQSGSNREPRENQERERHHPGGLVRMAVPAVATAKGQEPQAEGVERREERSKKSERVQQVEAGLVSP